MHPDTHLVIQLQSLDRHVAGLEKEVAALPKHIATIEKTLDAHVRKLEADRAAWPPTKKIASGWKAKFKFMSRKFQS